MVENSTTPQHCPGYANFKNLKSFTCDCPKCGETIEDYVTGAGQQMADEMNVPFLGRVPLDPRVMRSGDAGEPFVSHMADSNPAAAFEKIVEPILALK